MATKEKTDPAWDHRQFIGGKMVSNHSANETGWRGDLYTQVITYLAHARGNI
jgi:hypothetical protein